MFKFEKAKLGASVEKFESIVGSSLRIEGDLIISQSLRIDGTVNGNIYQADGASATVAIAPGATVNGNIAVSDVIVSGALKGNIVAPGRVELIDTALRHPGDEEELRRVKFQVNGMMRLRPLYGWNVKS